MLGKVAMGQCGDLVKNEDPGDKFIVLLLNDMQRGIWC